MIRLLLLFVLSPVILFSQTLRKEAVDSIKAATVSNLYTVSSLLSTHPGTKVAQVDVFDTGEYVTIVVRIHVAKADTITPISPLALVTVNTGASVAAGVSMLTVPPLPPPVAETDVLPPLPLVEIKTGAIVVARMSQVTVPPLPAPVAEAVALPLQPVVQIKTGAVVALGVSMVTVSPLPPAVAEANALPLMPAVKIRTGVIVAVNVGAVTVPPLPPPAAEAVTMTTLPLVKIKTGAIVVAGVGTATVPPFPHPLVEMPVTELHLSADGYSLLEKLEGFSPELYSLKDGGFTIGFGFFLPYAEGDKWDNGVTLEEADSIIKLKVPAYEDQVKRYINVPVTQNVFDALTMLAYNLGGFSKATSIVNDINGQANFDKLQSDWNRFVHSKAPGVAKGLKNRRKDELGVNRYSDYQPERKLQILKIK